MTATPEMICNLRKVILVLTVFFISGCASITLKDWNEDFKESRQRTIEFAPTSVSADYLGKFEGAYVYKALDTKKQAVIFRLPAKNDVPVEIAIDDSEYTALPGMTAIFHFADHDKAQNSGSDFPQDIYVFTSDMMTSFRYSCKDGTFDNEVQKSIGMGIKCSAYKKNCHGLSSPDSFILGLRNAGYVIAVPIDVASMPVMLPLALIFASTYCGPFGCP